LKNAKLKEEIDQLKNKTQQLEMQISVYQENITELIA